MLHLTSHVISYVSSRQKHPELFHSFGRLIYFLPVLFYLILLWYHFLDPATKSWLREITDEVFGYPQFVRFSWSTSSNILDKHAKEVTW